MNEISKFLIAIDDKKRQTIIICLLEENDCVGIQVEELIAATGFSRPAISHHLKILKQAKIVSFHAVGTKNFYYLYNDTTEIGKL
ncbi:ArsR/SmtB family transcription factor [Spiroplasma melliferum]|uniref:ArsR/SmtB family transcription factor n=1 Tax=Spiroplasma melliferum TaxID=2134 RepID=UPI000C783306